MKYGGDEAAYAAASLDLKGVEMYNKLDLEGLHTLGTVVVDYRGYRIIAQSIIPRILQRDQENSVVYGSVDGGKTIATHNVFLEKVFYHFYMKPSCYISCIFTSQFFCTSPIDWNKFNWH